MSFLPFSFSKKMSMAWSRNLRKSLVLTLSLSIAIPLLSAPSAQAAPILTNYYQFEGNGTDSAGGQNASAIGSVNVTSQGKYGTGYASPGGGAGYLDMGQNVGRFGSSDFTIGFWFRSVGAGGHFINKRLDSLHFITIQLTSSGQIQTEFRSQSASNGADIYIGPVTPVGVNYTDGAWHHLALVRSGNVLNMYIDGQVSATDTGMGDMNFDYSIYNNANFIFGGSNLFPLGFRGFLDELAIYSSALSQAEVLASMLSVEPPPLIDQIPLTLTASGQPYELTRTLSTSGGTTGGEVTYSILASKPEAACELVGNVITFTGIIAVDGSANCFVDATMAGDSTYTPVRSNKLSVIYVKPAPPRDQIPLTLTASGTSADSSRTLIPDGGSSQGLITYNLVSANGPCLLVGDTVTFTGTATCEVTATMAGDVKYNPVTSDPLSVDYVAPPINQADLFVTSLFGTPSIPLALTTTGGSTAGVVSYRLNPQGGNSAGCSLDALGTSIIATNAGTCMVTATMAGNARYLDVSTFGTVITFPKVAQADLTIDQSSGLVGTPLTLTVTGGSGDGEITFRVLSGDCTLVGNSIVAASVDSCVVQANKSGGDFYTDYEARARITFTSPIQTPIVLTSKIAKVGTSLLLNFVGGSGNGAVTYSVVSHNSPRVCKIVNGVLSFTGVGSCSVTVFKAGDGTYLPASSAVTRVFFVAKP